VLPDVVLPSADLFVYYPGQRNESTRARAFIDFLVKHFEAPFVPVDVANAAPDRKRSARSKR
jgi:hypothetical protein